MAGCVTIVVQEGIGIIQFLKGSYVHHGGDGGIVTGSIKGNQYQEGGLPKLDKGPVLKTGRSVTARQGSSPWPSSILKERK